MGVGATGSGTDWHDRAKQEGLGRSGAEGEKSTGGLIIHFLVISVESSVSRGRLSADCRCVVGGGRHPDGSHFRLGARKSGFTSCLLLMMMMISFALDQASPRPGKSWLGKIKGKRNRQDRGPNDSPPYHGGETSCGITKKPPSVPLWRDGDVSE